MNFLEMTAGAIRSVDRDQTLVMLPIAAVEQHGPHMPTGTDMIICDAVAAEAERRCRSSVLRLPTQWLGASSHHLRFGATLTAELPTYIQLLCETLQPLLADGFRRFLLLNGHGGNIDPMRIALRQLQPDWPGALLSAACYWSIAEEAIAEILDGEDKQVGHACEAETSLVMHLRPELVDESAIHTEMGWLPDNVEGMFLCRDMQQRTRAGATGRPDLASAEKGQRLFQAIIDRIEHAVRILLQEQLPS